MPPRSSDDCGVGLCEYPSQLNSSALLFERAGECHERARPLVPTADEAAPEVAAPLPLTFREADDRRARREKETRSQHQHQQQQEPNSMQLQLQKQDGDRCTEEGPCASSILGDDLILCRLSSLLPPVPEVEAPASVSARRRPPLVRKVSSLSTIDSDATSSDESADDGDSSSSSSSRRRRPRHGPTPFALIPADAAVVLPTLLHHPDECRQEPVRSLLNAVGVEEVEALNPTDGGPTAGQCQFACIASALSRSFGAEHPLRAGYRPDLELRRLALHVIRMNPDLYRSFLTVAGGRTRKQNVAAGTSVDLGTYLRAMSNPACDGDAVTLQALCDALKISVRIVKPVDADAYDEIGQRERLCAAAANANAANASDDECDDEADDSDDASSTTSASSVSSSLSALSWSNNPYSSCPRIKHAHHRHSQPHDDSFDSDSSSDDQQHRRLVRQRLYVSQEIRPRHLPRIDSRIRDVQRVARGRLIWLSHIGDEAHYRFLRPMSLCDKDQSSSATDSSTSSCCPHGPVNEEEAAIARRSRLVRHRRLDSLLCSREDGYVRPYKAPSSSKKGSGEDDGLSVDVVSDDELRKLRKVVEPSLSPRCGLCFEGFFGSREKERGGSTRTTRAAANDVVGGSSQPVSPSGCDHDFCRGCIVSWSASVSNTCPTCGCHFMDLVDSKERVVVRSVSPVGCGSGTTVELSGQQRDDGGSGSDEDGSYPIGRRRGDATPGGHQPTQAPPALPASFDLVRAIEVQTNGEALAVSALNRQLLVEIGRDMHRAGGHSPRTGRPGSNFVFATPPSSERVLLRLLTQLSSIMNGPHLRDLLEANVLSIIRLLLTPSDVSSVIRPTRVGSAARGGGSGNDAPQQYVPHAEMLLMTLVILEGINRRSGIPGGRSLLTMDMLRRSLDLPKLLLWYISCPALRGMEEYREGLECARRVLASWSKQHCFSIVAALQKNSTRSSSSPKKRLDPPSSSTGQARKRPRPSPPSPNPAKKRKVAPAAAAAKTPSGAGKTKKRGRPLGSTKKKLKKQQPMRNLPMRAPPPQQPTIRIRRAAGKRQIRPAACVNISMDDWSSRMYRS